MSCSVERRAVQRKLRGCRIHIVGTGGQGVLTAARLLCQAGTALGRHVVSAQLHGMSQRSGSVQSSVMIDSGDGPVIACGQADFVVGLEPIETARALPLMSEKTVVFMNTAPIVPFVIGQAQINKNCNNGQVQDYPELARLADNIREATPFLFSVDASDLACRSGSAKVMNMIMLGCLLGYGSLPYSADDFNAVIMDMAPEAFKKANKQAFIEGVELGRGFKHNGKGA